MKNNKFTLLFLLFLGVFGFSQGDESTKGLSQYPQNQLKVDEDGNKYFYDAKQKAKIYEINGETVIVLDDLYLISKPRFNNQLDKNYYWFLNKKLGRVYPLFLTALEQYRGIQNDLKDLDKKGQKQYVKQRQSALADQYESQLRELTTTEGRVFAKLMYRATGNSVYDIIKELRGGWSAFWWNVKGNIADVDIKEPYSPKTNRSDLYLESLLQSNWNLGYLQPYPGYQTVYSK